MNAKKFEMMLIVVLVALFANTALVFAYPAEIPDVTPVSPAVSAGNCTAILSHADQLSAQVDIPSRRAEYASLDQLGSCQVIAAASITIPNTGRLDSGKQRYEAFKMRQIEQMSH